jgi:putative addiction module killer protein
VSYQILEYVDPAGRNPYRDWLMRLDLKVRARIQARVLRFEQGNLGDYKVLTDDLCEARFTFGAGYRIYFSEEKDHAKTKS